MTIVTPTITSALCYVHRSLSSLPVPGLSWGEAEKIPLLLRRKKKVEFLLLQQLLVARNERKVGGCGAGLALLPREAKLCVFHGDTQIPLYPLLPCQLKLEKSTEYLNSLTLKNQKRVLSPYSLKLHPQLCFVVCGFVSVFFLRRRKAIKFFS